MDLPERLARHLRERERLVMREHAAIPCAVLIPLLPLDTGQFASVSPAAGRMGTADGRPAPVMLDYDVVYTLRTEHLPNHKGQVAFPGGKCSGAEELLDTALRESAEEIGILPSDVSVLGSLDDVSTMAGQYVITPWVGLLPAGYAFRANPREVADIFSVRLSALGDPRHHGQTRRQWGGNDYEVSVITAGRHEIWGATHQITRNFLDLVAQVRGQVPFAF